ncbi:MAG: DUF5615 family PIN-like protein [Ardenticatenales bacterium]|nr:DUF5615 family PIN-like protein [Ardenticatenales bacterium]
MKFLVDAHLPKRLAVQLIVAGHDALHTLDLPLENYTPSLKKPGFSIVRQKLPEWFMCKNPVFDLFSVESRLNIW